MNEVGNKVIGTDVNLDGANLEDNNEILIAPISQTEIENVILNLYNEKARARRGTKCIDNLKNEFIIYNNGLLF